MLFARTGSFRLAPPSSSLLHCLSTTRRLSSSVHQHLADISSSEMGVSGVRRW